MTFRKESLPDILEPARILQCRISLTMMLALRMLQWYWKWPQQSFAALDGVERENVSCDRNFDLTFLSQQGFCKTGSV